MRCGLGEIVAETGVLQLGIGLFLLDGLVTFSVSVLGYERAANRATIACVHI